ncbi:MAG: hypothetical protein COY38_04990 [Candidatus Aenigmarchaeota archaeon CG_4_10_14_0_8_um_filter_37_24]|nr:hypothetical protein [Candidatus Aenigmarchaeota archaeon]OIN86330.1 MAG: hypothetical protein AUJ50_03875 [Candidatus Aenigmarchaeota archaeon CG1_02_38_14]PIV68053.1 MAG: hypothetical protein COS07_05460 [Candidatus Aenigmarchaeota archaeon CG01_land_8_20_14_3_00_37_9]PIW40755.1 MAG: hypothetical protein COW21_05440 [Candidatus Aenigmarchaeota archaeon CG15_BIG_FIL_POST_REV_8_21_14_020_37_27]PIX51029.1 MAG: hypothetical protein COZ52_01070 [Candidatus Aenigmarchaeota archaeon CG_4_8_14_3_u
MICIIDCGTSWLEEIKKNVSELKKPYKVIKFDEIEDCKFKSFSGIIISGAPTLLTQVDLKKYMSLFRFIKTVSIPILGICLGHQIIGLLYGSEVHVGKMVNKKEKIEIVKQDDLFLGIKNNSLFQEEHSEFITLPEEFQLLAKSKTCDNEAMKHKKRKIYGVQFHPEVSGSNGKMVLDNFLKIRSNN